MEPLSHVLALLKPQTYVSAGLNAGGKWALEFPAQQGIKFNAVTQGSCWIAVEGGEPHKLEQGDCFLLTSGRPFVLASDLLLPRESAQTLYHGVCDGVARSNGGGDFFLVGARFSFTGKHADALLGSLPALVPVREPSDQASVLRWALERFEKEIRDPSPGGSLITEHLAHIMLIQVLRLHLASERNTGVGWLYVLTDPQLGAAVTSMHADVSHRWTLEELGKAAGMSRSSFASRFKQVAGVSPMEYLAQWRIHLAADRLRTTADSVASIASAVGYESDAAFSNAFKKATGHSPKRYRHDHRAASSSPVGERRSNVQRNVSQ